VAELLAFEVGRARVHDAVAEPGIELLAPSSRPCVRVAFELYGGILDEVERAGYQVLDRRVAVPRHRRLGVAGRHWAAAQAAARAERQVSVTTPGPCWTHGHSPDEPVTDLQEPGPCPHMPLPGWWEAGPGGGRR
jgi:hypothetical protein